MKIRTLDAPEWMTNNSIELMIELNLSPKTIVALQEIDQNIRRAHAAARTTFVE